MSAYTDFTKMENTRNCQRRIARHAEQEFSKDSIVNVMEKFVRSVNLMDDTILVPCRLMDRQVGDSTDILVSNNENQTVNQLTKPHNKRSIVHSKNVHEFLSASELLNLYNMLNSLKNELLWTGTDPAVEEEENAFSVLEKSAGLTEQEAKSQTVSTETNATNTSNTTTNGSMGKRSSHVRRPSMSSVASVTSVGNLSDDSELCNESDSGMESESQKSGQSSAGSVSSSDDVHTQNVDKATELAKRCKRHLNGLYRCLEQMTEAANYLTARYQSDIGPV